MTSAVLRVVAQIDSLTVPLKLVWSVSMTPLDSIDLDGVATEHRIPGAVVAILSGGEANVRAFGVLNVATEEASTPDSLFQIGSITKLWTATVIMQLVEQHALDLDAFVRQYLPDFRVGDDDAAASITVRHLLTHTSGIADDYTPTTRGDDALAKYVNDVVPKLALEFHPGADFNYSNAAYVVLGRIAEILCGKPYHEVLRERIATPLGLQRWAPVPEEALLFRTAVGHLPTSDGAVEPAAAWSMSAAHSPAGSQVAMTAASLLAFAGAYLRGGPPLVSEQTAEQMWVPEPNIPELGGSGGQLAIGGVIQRVDDTTIIGYDGATYGQSASLRILPTADMAVVSMANGGNMFAFHQSVLSRLVHHAAGIELPGPPVPPRHPEPVNAAFVCGQYRGRDLEVAVTAGHQGSVLVTENPLSEELRALLPSGGGAEFVRLDDRKLIGTSQHIGVYPVIAIIGDSSSPATAILHYGRTLNRVDSA